jgi:integrase
MATIKKRSWITSKGEPREAWVVRYADQSGVWRLKTFARQRGAKDWLAELLPAVAQGTHMPESTAPTVSTAAAAWIRRGEADGKERSTIKQRRQHVDHHILPLLGAGTKLSRIDVAEFRDELLTTRSRALAKKVMTSLKAIAKQAKMAHLAADVEKIETGGRHRKRLEIGRDIPTPDEVRALLAAATGYMRALLAVAVFCGLRMSEVRALRWLDVDFDARRLHVRQRADKWGSIGPLKSETSYRSVPMSPFVVNTVREWKLACPKGELDLVFPNGAGNVESLPNIWNRRFAPLQVACGIVEQKLDGDGIPVFTDDRKPVMVAKYGLHALRHFFASWLIDQSFNVKRISALMGHSSPMVTLTIYAHLMPADDDHEKFAVGETALVG